MPDAPSAVVQNPKHDSLDSIVVSTLIAAPVLIACGALWLFRRSKGARKAAENEARFFDLANNIREAFWIVAPDFTRTLYVSPAFSQVWGLDLETVDWNPRALLDTVHPDDRAIVSRMFNRLPREEVSLEHRIIRSDGAVRWLWQHGFPVRDERGHVQRIVGLTEDITDRKRLEETDQFLSDASDALARSLEYESTLATVARIAVPRFADWCVASVVEHGQLRRLIAAHRDPELERVTRTMLQRFPLDPAGPGVVARVLRTGTPELIHEVTDGDLARFTADEEHVRMLRQVGLHSVIIVPLPVRGKSVGAISFVRGRRRRGYTEADLRLAQELARRLALAIDNALLLRDAQQALLIAERRAREEAALREATEAVSASFTVEGVIQQIARSALTATGADGAVVERIEHDVNQVTVVAVAGERTLPLGARLNYQGSLAQHVIERETPQHLPVLSNEAHRISADLVRACPKCSALAVPLIDAGEAIGSLILLREPDREFFSESEMQRGRTFANLASLAFRKVHLLEETEQRREELERLIESRARLIRGFSHDVKNPLGAADGRAQLLEDGVFGELSEKQKDSIRGIRRSIGTALELINTLVEIARVESGQIDIASEPVDVREIARELADEYRSQARTAGLFIEYSGAHPLPVVTSDASRIRQVLGNLVSNAVKYTREGGVTIRVEPRERGPGAKPRNWVAVDVIDTGIGIPKDKQHLLFQEFSRLGEDSSPGVGLGLAISYRIARALGADITCVSEPGKGSTFTLWLPVGSAEARHLPAE